MPLLKHAKKKLKQDKKRTILNKKVKNTFKISVKKAKEEKSAKAVSAAFKAVDKAVKKNIIHKNKAARMKSALSKLVGGKSKAPSAAKTNTTTSKSSAKPTNATAVKKTATKTAAKPKAASKKSSKKTTK